MGNMRTVLYCGAVCVAVLAGLATMASPGEQRRARAREAAFSLTLPQELARLYEALPDSGARARWEEKYWRMIDPLPSSPQNPYREEFETRFAYAWEHFSCLVGPTYLDDRAKYYLRYGPPDDSVEMAGSGRQYLDNLTWAYFGLNLFVDFVRRMGYGYQEVNDLSQAVVGVPLNEKARIACELYAERESLHHRYGAFRGAQRNADAYFSLVSGLATEKTQALGLAPPHRFSFQHRQQPLSAQLASACFRAAEGATRVEFYFSVPLEELSFSPGDKATLVSHLHKRLTLFDEDYQPLLRRSETLELTAGAREEIARRSYVNQHDELLTPGLYNVALELECPESDRLAVLKSQLRVRSFAGDSLMISDLQLSLRIVEQVPARHLKPNGVLVVPTLQRQFPRGKPVFVYFEVYNLRLDSSGKSDYHVAYALRSAGGSGLLTELAKAVSFLVQGKRSEAVEMAFRSQGTADWEQRYVQLDMSNCPAGRTELVVTVTDHNTGQQASAATSFVLE
ncbi:MAG: GWxTD domain-containing protein [bacterium]|jgi:GWxTD domain-containing protein|nr:GWxTD domain-containing protein [candidate division KSB1 bacterium]MDH7558975.1 GWxTD domain-containing protein [bacterium]